MQRKIRLAVFASGGGTNLQAIIDGCSEGSIDASVAVVVCNNPEAYSIERAKSAGIPVIIIDHRHFKTRGEHEEAIVEELEKHKVDLIALAGYMRIFTPSFVRRFYDNSLGSSKIINIHPALLPKYPGAHAYEDAFNAKEKHSGITVHFVDEGVDTGPVILQEKVPILPTDTLEDFRKRGLAAEHRLYPEAINKVVRKLRGG